MINKYYKIIDGQTVKFKEPLILNEWQIFNPSQEQMEQDGWILDTSNPVSREDLIHAEIRARYSENDEFMINRRYLLNPNNYDYKREFIEYSRIVEEIIAKYPKDE